MKSTTALLARIEAEKQNAAQAERDERLAVARGEQKRVHAPVWAVDHLMRVGAISSAQHEAATRYMRARQLILDAPMACFSADRVDSARADPHERQLRRARSVTEARAVAAHVMRRLRKRPGQARVFEALFAFPLPSMKALRGPSSGSRTEQLVVSVLDVVTEAVEKIDAAPVDTMVRVSQ